VPGDLRRYQPEQTSGGRGNLHNDVGEIPGGTTAGVSRQSDAINHDGPPLVQVRFSLCYPVF